MIQRDGYLRSLWQDVFPYQVQQPHVENGTYDVAIVGGGITGITTGLLLQKAGLKCVILEANTICFGTTAGTTAHLNTLLDVPYTTLIKNFGVEKASLAAQAARDAINLIKQNIAEYKIDCGFEEVPAYLFAQNEDQVKELNDIHEASGNVGVVNSFTNYIPIPLPFEKAIEIPAQAKFHPVKYVHALAKAFENQGGIIVQHIPVQDVKEENELLKIITTKESFKALNVIYATHIPPGISLVDLRCIPYRSYAIALKLKDEKYPQGLAYDMYDPYHYYRTQEIEGVKYLIVGGEDHKTAHEPNTNARFLNLESHVRTYFEVDEIVNTWSSQYFEPVDGLPYIGFASGRTKNIYIATGYGGNGMIYSHVAAKLLTDMVTNKSTRYDKLFSPSRIKPVAGFTEFVEHNMDVAKQFVGKFFQREKLEEIVSLAPGEGKVVKYENEKLALYKSEEGVLHAISPICTHMKCSVNWNVAEKSWDCPCHGARYSYDGKVLTGPAVNDLEIIDLQGELVSDQTPYVDK